MNYSTVFNKRFGFSVIVAPVAPDRLWKSKENIWQDGKSKLSQICSGLKAMNWRNGDLFYSAYTKQGNKVAVLDGARVTNEN